MAEVLQRLQQPEQLTQDRAAVAAQQRYQADRVDQALLFCLSQRCNIPEQLRVRQQ